MNSILKSPQRGKKALWAVLTAALLILQSAMSAQATSGGNQAQTPSGMLLADMEENIDAIMDKHVGESVPGAVIAVVKDGQIVFKKGYGKADIAGDIDMNPDSTVMEAGSVSKLYTWTAVMQLAEQGKLDLDEDISAYLPEGFVDRSFSDPLTMKHLMSHTAGYEEHIEGMMPQDTAKIVSLEEYLSKGTQRKQVFRPGTVMAYSNYSTNLAGYIVERISGMSFADYVEENILSPLDMERSTFEVRFDLVDGIGENKAKGYEKPGEDWQELPVSYINDIPAGSLNTTAVDMANFMIAQMNYDGNGAYKLFQNNETLEMFQGRLFSHYETLPGNAHGFWEYTATGKRIIEHGGNTEGFTTRLTLAPDENFGVCILTNAASEMAGAIRDVAEALVGLPQEASAASAEFNHAKEVEGVYSSARTIYTNFFAATNVLSNMNTTVTANAQGGIDVAIPALDVHMTFVETEPYYFERIETESNAYDKAGVNTQRLYFVRNEEGEVTQLSYGTIADDLRLSPLENHALHLFAVVAVTLIFLLGLIWSIIAFIRRGKTTRGLTLLHANMAMSAVGILLVANLLVAVLRLLSDPMQLMANFNGQILGFWILAVIEAALLIFSVARWFKKGSGKGDRVLSALLIMATGVLMAFLLHYHFFRFA